MNEYVKTAKQYIEQENYKESIKLARKRHGKDDIDSYISILDLLIEKEYLPALEEKGMYYQYYDPNHDNGDYGEKYFDKYLEKQPRSINALCDKAMSRFNKGDINEALKYMDKAYEKYSSYSKIEKPRIGKKEVLMGKIELQMESELYEDALKGLDKYENQYGSDEKLDLFKGVMLQKNAKNEEALTYLDASLRNENTLLAFNAKGDALFELKRYKEALKNYKYCLRYENEIKDDLALITNFNYKAAFCCVELNEDKEAIKYLNKTINMLNEHGRLPKDIESIYQKCSFEKERILKQGIVEDKEFKNTKFLSIKTSIYIIIIILVLYIILKILGYG